MSAAPELAWLIAHITYKPGWKFALRTGYTSTTASLFNEPEPVSSNMAGSFAHTIQYPIQPSFLVIELHTTDSGDHESITNVQHTFAVPWSHSMLKDWDRWVFHCIMAVETHEAMEFFGAAGVKPFYPDHGPNADLYTLKRKAELPFPVREDSQ